MHTVPAFKRTLQNRKLGKFTSWPLGQFLEWITLTWWKFNVAMLTVLFFASAATSPGDTQLTMVQYLFVVPAAIVAYPVFKILIFVSAFIPIVNIPIGFSRILYYTIFSRFVVETAPKILMPVWFRF